MFSRHDFHLSLLLHYFGHVRTSIHVNPEQLADGERWHVASEEECRTANGEEK